MFWSEFAACFRVKTIYIALLRLLFYNFAEYKIRYRDIGYRGTEMPFVSWEACYSTSF
jgi:hypothetical protein